MKLNSHQSTRRRRNGAGAFTLVEAIFAIAMAGIMFLALYSGLAFGLHLVQMVRENTRATQIMVEKMETIRLYTWNQITNAGFVPTNKFTVSYYSVNGTNAGLTYTGRINIAACPLGTSYSDNMKKVTIRLDWGQLGTTNRTRQMTTYVTRNGLQNYVW